MTDYIVLVKQVPDVSQINDNAFNPKTGNLMRGKLENVINELDKHALALANKMKQLSGDKNSRIVCLTMGLPMAKDVLLYGLSRCADEAVLLTDRALGGADTYATANSLGAAIKKICKDVLRNDSDYIIVSGMQSVDGDTAQVPPQTAEMLGLSCIAYVTDVRMKRSLAGAGSFEFVSMVKGGSQTIVPKNLPLVITTAKFEETLYPSFSATRKANCAEVITLSASDIEAKDIGAEGSRTQVVRVFQPEKSARKCVRLTSVQDLAKTIAQISKASTKQSAATAVGAKPYVLPKNRASAIDRSFEGFLVDQGQYHLLQEKIEKLGLHSLAEINAAKEQIVAGLADQIPAAAVDELLQGYAYTETKYSGEVWVMGEVELDGHVSAATFELIGKARGLADSLETKAAVVLCGGTEISAKAQELIYAGADKVHLISNPLLAVYDPKAHCQVVAQLLEECRPQILLFGATPYGRVLAPMVSFRSHCGLTADCTSLDLRDNSKKGEIGVLLQTRPALGGNVMATIATKRSWCQLATARPGVMKRLQEDKSRSGEIIKHEVELNEDEQSLLVIETSVGKTVVNFDVDVIVSGGRGMQSRENYEKQTSELANQIKQKLGVSTQVAASRAAVEQGYNDRSYQVGQTGTSVASRVYVAIGISGAIQHCIGLSNVENIVAINHDPRAPIFGFADYYYVGDLNKVVPELVAELARQQNS